MVIVTSVAGIPVRLTDERWGHVMANHPEVRGYRTIILATVSEPDKVQQGDYGELLAIRSLGNRKSLVVVYREASKSDGFILTAYITRRVSNRRKTIWSRR